MRILQIIQKKQLRGAEVFACTMSNHLVALGHTVKVISLADGDAALPFKGGVQSLSLNLKNRFLDWRGWKKLSSLISEFKPDVVQANAGDTLKYAVLSKLVFGWKVPIVFRNASMVSSYIQSPLIKVFNGFLMSKVDYILSVSNASRRDLLKTFPSVAGRIAVIPIGIEEIPLLPLAREAGYTYVIHVGGFSFEKNHKGLLRIFKGVRSKVSNVRLLLVGDGVLRNETEVYCKELGLENDVTFLGYKGNALDYIAAADVLVLPSIIEGLPGVILEAFYTKTPVVAYQVGGIEEIVENGITGSLIEKNNEQKFVDAVVDVLEGTSDAKAQAERGHERVMNTFMNIALAKEFIAVYQKLVRVNH